MKEVTIVGGGMAGLTAALRLQQRGFKVTLYEQDDFLGGKWGAYERGYDSEEKKKLYHEHCYHMMLNWFNNFWRIVDELGLRDQFIPKATLKYLRPGEYPRTTELRDVGSPYTIWANLFSGVLPVADSFLYTYSLVDLVSQRINPNEFLDRYSVNGFMHSRPYATAAAAKQHERTLAKAFACPSYLSSASTYKNFIKYGLRHPSPMVWVLKGNCQEYFQAHLEERLTRPKVEGEIPCEIHKLARVQKIYLDSGRVTGLDIGRMSQSPSIDMSAKTWKVENVDVKGYLIVTVPPRALSRLVDQDLFREAPELGSVRKLYSQPMASLDLYFNKKLRNVPDGHVVLWESKYDLTFIDNSQIWPDEPFTFLNVVASDFDVLDFDGLLGMELSQCQKVTRDEAIRCILEELRKYVPFEDEDIDWRKTYIQTNTGETLFMNEVGSWKFRPCTETRIENMFLAGDYCRSVIDVVTLEAATVTGLMAAEAVRSRERVGDPIEIIEPDYYPEAFMSALKLMWAPYAYAAKVWSWTGGRMLSSFGRR